MTLRIKNIHIRYEDDEYVLRGPTATGILIDELVFRPDNFKTSNIQKLLIATLPARYVNNIKENIKNSDNYLLEFIELTNLSIYFNLDAGQYYPSEVFYRN